jgi:hypothetical protein
LVYLCTLPLTFACGGGASSADGNDETQASESQSSSDSQSSESQGEADTQGADDGPPPDLPAPLDPITTVGEILLPFDVNLQDQAGPGSWDTNYGKSPELIALPHGNALYVYAQNYDTDDAQKSVLLRLEPSVDDYVITAYTEPPFLDRIMGLSHDGADRVFVASGIVEDLHQPLTVDYPAPGEYRSDVVRIVATDWAGNVEWNTDLDLARQAFDQPELLINPMVAASSRMAYGADTLALLHGINTDPDSMGTRHQKAITTHVSAADGSVTRSSSIWVSHSFDQRMHFDGDRFIEMHHGDAYPRHVAFAGIQAGDNGGTGEYPLFHIKGDLGDNVTRTQIGDVALIENDPMYGYLAVFISERSAGTDDLISQQARIAGTREVAMVRVLRDFEIDGGDGLAHLDPSLPHTLDVQSSGEARTNRLRWLTDYDSGGTAETVAERAKLVGIGDDQFIVMWERHELDTDGYVFAGSYAMTIDAHGDAIAGPSQISDSRLPRGDDAFALEGGAAFLTGDSMAKELHLHIISPQLEERVVVIE